MNALSASTRDDALPEAEILAGVPRIHIGTAKAWVSGTLSARRDERSARRRPWLVTIDGRSGCGKTVLSAALLEAYPEAQILHLDDLYRDWDRLPSGVVRARHMVEMWRRGESPSYRPTHWPGTPRRTSETITPGRPLVVEGCGSTWVGRKLADAQMWLDVDRETRRLRALERDGEKFAPFWLRWEQQETQWYDAHAPLPDVVVTTAS